MALNRATLWLFLLNKKHLSLERDSSLKKRKLSQYLLTLMLTEGQVKFFSQRNTAGDSLQKGVVVISRTIVMNGDQISDI